jgi:hypothetical protein
VPPVRPVPAGETCTGQASATHRSDRFQPESPKTPNRPTELQTDPNSKQQQHGTTENSPKHSPERNPTRVSTGQTGERHRSDRCDLASRDEQHPRVYTPKSKPRYPESLHELEQDFGDSSNSSWGVHSQVYVHQNLPKQDEMKKSCQELL